MKATRTFFAIAAGLTALGAVALSLPGGASAQGEGSGKGAATSGEPVLQNRSRVGTIDRRYVNGTLSGFRLNATYAGGVPGTWAANDTVTALGDRQGCSVN